MSIKTIDIISCICAVLSIVLVGLACFVPIIFTNEAFNDRFVFDETGQIGDTIGGTMSPVVAIAGVFMTFIAFLMQVNANRIQSEQLCTTDGKGRVTNISVNFSKAEHIAANCPYIIKVSKPVTEFTLENEYLIPAEEPAVTVNGDKFIGGYAANTILDSGVLLWRSRRNGRNEPRCPRNESTAPQRVGRLKRKTIRIAKRFELLISPLPFRLLSFCTHKSS